MNQQKSRKRSKSPVKRSSIEDFHKIKSSINTENLLKVKRRSSKTTANFVPNMSIPLKNQKQEKHRKLNSKKSTVNLDKNLKQKAREINEQINNFRRLSRKYTQNQLYNRYQQFSANRDSSADPFKIYEIPPLSSNVKKKRNSKFYIF